MKANENIKDQDWENLAKSIYDKGPVTENRETAPEDESFSSNEKRQILEMAGKVDLYFEQKKYPAEQAWEKVNARIQRQSAQQISKVRKLILNPFLRIAAAVLFAALIVVSVIEVYYNNTESRTMLEISAADSILKSFTLPDGTVISLNSGTNVKYPKQFAENTREVTIEGEAFFQVKPNKAKPFIIHAGNTQIKVLGTSFNVNAYPEAKTLEVIVETGRVQVLSKTALTEENKELILTPGEKGTLDYAENSLIKSTNQNPNFLAWKTHNLVFKATSLLEVVENLKNVYKVNIRLADPKMNELLLTAQFKDYPLDFILKVIETTFKIEVQQEKGEYILKARS
jgi:ferric-dicitrate binding protein FerR (iron transport regulator)